MTPEQIEAAKRGLFIERHDHLEKIRQSEAALLKIEGALNLLAEFEKQNQTPKQNEQA